MVEEIEVWRAANQLVERYGEDAELEAAMRADAMIEAGDVEGQRVWNRGSSRRLMSCCVNSRNRANPSISPVSPCTLHSARS